MAYKTSKTTREKGREREQCTQKWWQQRTLNIITKFQEGNQVSKSNVLWIEHCSEQMKENLGVHLSVYLLCYRMNSFWCFYWCGLLYVFRWV